jgi:hypothetical protein
MRDARAAANGERTVTSVPMSLTHAPGAPARRLLTVVLFSLLIQFLFDLSSPPSTS